MQITEIKKVGKGFRYNVYVDENYIGTFEAEILAKYKWKTGQEVAQEEIDKVKIVNGDLACFDRALGVLEKSMKTEKLLRDYLKEKGYPEECIDRAIDKLQDYGYINDGVYAENYIGAYSHMKGRRKLKYDLLSKGVPADVVEEKLDELLDEDEQYETCRNLTIKYMKNKQWDQKTKQKLFSHLVGRGFELSLIGRVAREVYDDRD